MTQKRVTKNEFRHLFKEWRNRLQMTQEQAAEYLGVSVHTVRAWELPSRIPSGLGYTTIMKEILPNGIPVGGITIEREEPKISKHELKKYLKDWRERTNMTQAQAATYLKVNISTYQKWENEQTIPNEWIYESIMKEILPAGIPSGELSQMEVKHDN